MMVSRWHRPLCRHTRPWRQGLRRRRPQPAAARWSRPRSSPPGSAPRRCSAFPQPSSRTASASSPTLSVPSLCPQGRTSFSRLPVQAQHPDPRRLLSPALQPHGRGGHHGLASSLSYLGWVAGTDQGAGLIFFVVTDGAGIQIRRHDPRRRHRACSPPTFGGMFSVAILDFVQMAVSIRRPLVHRLDGEQQGRRRCAAVIDGPSPPASWTSSRHRSWLWLTFIGTWVTMMLGSIRSRTFPACHVGEARTIAGRLDPRRLDLFLLHLRADVHRLFATLIDPALFNPMLAKDTSSSCRRWCSSTAAGRRRCCSSAPCSRPS